MTLSATEEVPVPLEKICLKEERIIRTPEEHEDSQKHPFSVLRKADDCTEEGCSKIHYFPVYLFGGCCAIDSEERIMHGKQQRTEGYINPKDQHCIK